MSIIPAALMPGDIIFSTTDDITSAVVRKVTGDGPVSHALIYAGDLYDTGVLFVVESMVGEGVVLKKLDVALEDDILAVALRRKNLTPSQRTAVVGYARDRIGTPFDVIFSISQARVYFQGKPRSLDLKNDSRKLFCTELVLDAFQSANAPLVPLQPPYKSPNDLIQLEAFGDLEYVGHLKY